ncbi:response regulator [Cellulomonas aerilata]|uniref:DNA-binding response regulator n=1 Tax=Cellulomonas aerilata TaxID=515326 RepID=A0A512D8I3_9CELL|nr:response regulator [Cellulomonas aerilata]GEO32705.1 DNA-binding response regulator [Cellulomonas aerilata]
MTQLLLVEDDATIVRTLTVTLGAHGYRVEAVGAGSEAIERARSGQDEVLLVDLGLPDIDGIDVVRAVRMTSTVPILVLSARDGRDAKVAALDAGADDYVTKPFDMSELLARLRAALRRARPAAAASVVRAGDLVIDRQARRVERAGRLVHLSPTEWNLLDVLVRTPGSLVTQREILREVWGPQYFDETNYLRVYVAQLRRKLEDRPSQPRHLLTDPGVGYRFEP